MRDMNLKLSILEKDLDVYKKMDLSLDMSRGKPSPEQLALSEDMYKNISTFITKSGVDARNYSLVRGLPDAIELFAELMEVQKKNVIIGGNSSLNLMYDLISKAFTHGLFRFDKKWCEYEKIKFICPTPGYDRHFAICQLFNIEMINVDLNEDGPDMEVVEKLVAEDDAIKGMWCVPKYSNPTGITYSDEIVKRLASMKTKASDFRIFWDNAYIVHHLTNKYDELTNISTACDKAGNPDRAYVFVSTSKVTFSGGGISAMASSIENMSHLEKLISIQTIGPNKINQLLHVNFLKNVDGILEHMKKHAKIVKPKFEKVIEVFNKNMNKLNIAEWTNPNGGYFISLNVEDNCAKEVIKLAGKTGVKLTGAGATYPYKLDPRNRNIRIAPTYPTVDELGTAMEVLCKCIEIVSLKKQLKSS